MAGTITTLEVQKRNKERVNVYLDGQYAFGVTLVAATKLRKGQQLSDEDIDQLKGQDKRDKAYNHAIYFLGFRSRSQSEIENYLRGKKYSPEAITETVERLREEEYLSDESFARTWVAERERFRPRSRKALRYELRQKGVSDTVIENVLADVDEDELAWRAIEGKIRQWQHLDRADFNKKALGFLSRRGFNYEIARQAVDRAWESIHGQF